MTNLVWDIAKWLETVPYGLSHLTSLAIPIKLSHNSGELVCSWDWLGHRQRNSKRA